MNMSIMQGTSSGMGMITQVYYQTQAYLSVTMLGFLISSEMVGRLLDTVLLFLPYRAVAVLLGLTGIGSIFFLIVLPEKENRPVYVAQHPLTVGGKRINPYRIIVSYSFVVLDNGITQAHNRLHIRIIYYALV